MASCSRRLKALAVLRIHIHAPEHRRSSEREVELLLSEPGRPGRLQAGVPRCHAASARAALTQGVLRASPADALLSELPVPGPLGFL